MFAIESKEEHLLFLSFSECSWSWKVEDSSSSVMNLSSLFIIVYFYTPCLAEANMCPFTLIPLFHLVMLCPYVWESTRNSHLHLLHTQILNLNQMIFIQNVLTLIASLFYSYHPCSRQSITPCRVIKPQSPLTSLPINYNPKVTASSISILKDNHNRKQVSHLASLAASAILACQKPHTLHEHNCQQPSPWCCNR